MWVPTIQGFTKLQDIQSRDHSPGTCNQFAQDRQRELESQEYQTPTCPSYLTLCEEQLPHQTSNAKHQLIFLGERTFLVPLQRENNPFGKRSNKEKVVLQASVSCTAFF